MVKQFLSQRRTLLPGDIKYTNFTDFIEIYFLLIPLIKQSLSSFHIS